MLLKILNNLSKQLYVLFCLFIHFLLGSQFSSILSVVFSQTIIPNLTSYSVYIVNIQAASLSTYKSHRMLLGSHSASRKVNLMFFLFCFFAHNADCCCCSCERSAFLSLLRDKWRIYENLEVEIEWRYTTQH